MLENREGSDQLDLYILVNFVIGERFLFPSSLLADFIGYILFRD